MRRRTKISLVAGGTVAVAAGTALVRDQSRRRAAEMALPDEDAMFTVFTPGGSQAFWCTGPVGWLTSKLMPIVEAGVYRTVAEMLDLRPDDELLDIGCGPGGFLAAHAQHVHRVVGLDTSPLMLRTAERRLAARIASGTAELMLGANLRCTGCCAPAAGSCSPTPNRQSDPPTVAAPPTIAGSWASRTTDGCSRTRDSRTW
jgi:hypothetical protein